MSQLREGDIFLFNQDSGGTIQVTNGEPLMDGGFESAVYLSLFGNNNSPWWSNEYLELSEQLQGEFIGFIEGNAKSISNLNRAQEFALNDLQWFKVEGIADTITVEVVSVDRQRVDLNVELFANGDLIFENTFEINWGFQLGDPASARVIVPATQLTLKQLATSTGRLFATTGGNPIGAMDEV